MSTTPSASPSRCSLAALERGDVPVGTAVPARYWMLVGHPGPWPAKPIAAPGIADVRADLDAALGRFGARLQLIRRHGRLEGDQIEAEGQRQVFLVDVHRGLVGRAHWERPEDLVELAGRFDDLPDPTSEPLFLVCTHGRKDVCCAVEGRVVAAVLDDALPGAVWETTHLGGDRFAGNVVILPEGSMYGRLTGDTAPRVVLDHLDGRVDLDRWRGRCSWHPAAQAAAHDLMRADPTVLLRDLARPRLEERGDEAWLVHLDHGGGTSLRHVVRTMSAPHQLTCGGAAKVQALFDVTTPG
ncbi:sucrase ferredoxin [Janibacter sp. YB324]|uniref:sucrase ferredoxin n=1 Tax=Janibacter sp. YB324 TaxID=2761047 RepID=UPI001625F15F|nr:sucrase ferredoxin [Janibacter sp. YB324]QNF94023.1 sucrase ferredoxin [Janibacter sp. YB324]